MSLRYEDTSLSELLGRPSLRFAEIGMRNTLKCACVIQEVLKFCLFSLNKIFQIFRHSCMGGF